MAEIFTVPIRGIGLPDYAAPKPVGQVPIGPIYTSSDVAEQAARLGSIVTYDRRGNVAILDDFEGVALNWQKSFSGTGAIYFSSSLQRHGSQHVMLSTGAAMDDYTRIFRRFALLGSEKCGIEFSIAGHRFNNENYIRMDGFGRRAEVMLEYTTGLLDSYLKVLIPDGVGTRYEVFANLGMVPIIFTSYESVKLVADFETGKYMRFLKGNHEYDLSSYDLPPIASAPYMEAYLGIITKIVDVRILHADMFIFTQNEPASIIL